MNGPESAPRRWLVERLALGAATAAALTSWILVVRSGAHLYHYDARAHMVVSRRVLDSLTPGWIQLGGVWLPLPHVVNVLPAASDYLYATAGFASLLGLACFLAGLFALGRAARVATDDAWAAAVAIAVPALNPGWLYLLATPMTEPLFFAPVCALALFIVRWRRRQRWPDLAAAAACSAVACLVRYEAWPIALAAAAAAFWRLPSPLPRRDLLGRAVPLFLGGGLIAPIALYALHSWVATERILYVIDSRNLSRPHGNLTGSALLELVGGAAAFGPPLLLLGLACLAVLLWRRRPEALLVLALTGPALVTFSAYVAGHPPKARYPLLLAPAFALAVALATRGRRAAQLVALAVAAAQPLTVPMPLPVLVESTRSLGDDRARRPRMEAFRQQYRGGGVLVSMGSNAPLLFDLQLPLREFVHEGNGSFWDYAAVDPARYVRWVLITPGDVLDQIRAYRPRFPEGFVEVGRIGRVTVYALGRPFGAGQVLLEPSSGQPCDALERPRLLEQVRGAGDHVHPHLRAHARRRRAVHADHGDVVASDDQERGGGHARQGVLGEIGPSAAGDDGEDLRPLGGRDQGGPAARAGPEIADRETAGEGLSMDPIRDRHQPAGEEADVEAHVAGDRVFRLLAPRQEVDQERPQSRLP